MGYSLDIRDHERAYLRNLPLTRLGMVKVHTAINEMVREVEDDFRNDRDNRPSSPSPYYHFTKFFKDGDEIRSLYVAIDDSNAAYGVLRIVYVECR